MSLHDITGGRATGGSGEAQLQEGVHHIFNPSAMYRLDFVRAKGLRYDPNLWPQLVALATPPG